MPIPKRYHRRAMNRRQFTKKTLAAAITSLLKPAWGRQRGGVAFAGVGFSISVGANIPVGGGPYLVTENLPIFKNQVRQGAFLNSAKSAPSAVNSSGWPVGDVYVSLSQAATLQTWMTSGTFSCGFVGSGSETITGQNCTISSVVPGTGGAYTTFTLTVTGINFGFSITGTSGAPTNIFAYAPGFSGSVIDNPTSTSAFRPDSIAHYKNYAYLRFMQWSDAMNNTQFGTSANRNTASNTQSQPWPNASAANYVTFSPAPSNAQGTTLTLNAPFAPPSMQNLFNFYNNTLNQNEARFCTFTQGSTSVTIDTALDSGDSYAATGSLGYDGYSIDCAVAFANACNIGIWINLPIWEDGSTPYGAAGSYCTGVMSYVNSNYTGPGPVYFETSNEIWNSGTPVFAALQKLVAQSGLSETTYLAQRAHALANIGRTIFSSQWGSKYQQVFAWQQGGLGTFCPVMSYLQSTYGSASADIQCLATAPYITPTVGNTDSISTIESEVAALAPNAAFVYYEENVAITAMHYGAELIAYESGVQWNAVNNNNANVGLAIMDAGMTAPLETYYTALYNGGYSSCTHFTEGVDGYYGAGGSQGNLSPQNEMAVNTATYLSSGSPTYNAVSSFFNGFVPTRNVVSGSGSVIDAINYADNSVATGTSTYPYLGELNEYLQGPFNDVTGQIGYRISCMVPGTYSLGVYFTTTSSGTCEVEVNGTILNGGSAFSIANGLTNQLGLTVSVTLTRGNNYVLLGQSGAQSGIIPKSLHFT